MTNTKTCRLCNKEKTLKNSHIIPKFVFRWLKQTGGTFIRKADNPNKREEDGIKDYLLCNDCEQAFSKLEDKFARDIFYPYSNKNIQTLKYDNDLLKFSISVLYRLLLFNLDENQTFKEIHSSELTKARNEWREFLYLGKKLEKFNKIHIFFTKVELNNNEFPTDRFLNYYTRGIDGAIISNSKTCNVYVKMARIILIGEIKVLDNSDMKNTLISFNGGEFKTSQMSLSYEIREFLIDRVKQLNVFYDKVSDKQKNIAIENTNNYMKKNSNSDIAKIITVENNAKINENLNDFR